MPKTAYPLTAKHRSDVQVANRTKDLFGQGLSAQGKKNRAAASKRVKRKVKKKTSAAKRYQNQK